MFCLFSHTSVGVSLKQYIINWLKKSCHVLSYFWPTVMNLYAIIFHYRMAASVVYTREWYTFILQVTR